MLDALDDDERELVREAGQPQSVSPMLATLTDDYFSDEDWIFERKLDGERALGFRHGPESRLQSRNAKELNRNYPEIVDALGAQAADDFIVDGEVVAFEGAVTSFSRLQGRMQIDDPEEARATGIAVYYYVFDLVYVDGHDVTRLPLRRRKRLLLDLLDYDDPIRYTQHRNTEGEAYRRQACAKGWEGVIAKHADSSYQHARSTDWLKFKCTKGQELVIGGYTEPEGERHDFGAILVGYYDGDDLVYAGKIGTGFDEATLERLGSRMRSVERMTPPFDRGELPGKGVHWVRPDLVCAAGFTEWTEDGRLRHPRFLGLRRDKNPKDVVREEPRSIS